MVVNGEKILGYSPFFAAYIFILENIGGILRHSAVGWQ
jgi:hypothetical protein